MTIRYSAFFDLRDLLLRFATDDLAAVLGLAVQDCCLCIMHKLGIVAPSLGFLYKVQATKQSFFSTFAALRNSPSALHGSCLESPDAQSTGLQSYML